MKDTELEKLQNYGLQFVWYYKQTGPCNLSGLSKGLS